MTWIATIAKITNLGIAWLDGMLIPETTDPILGEDDPGGGTVAITAMGSASGQAFAYIINNLQLIRNIMVFEDTALTVTDLATLQTAMAVIDKIGYVHKDATLTVTIAATSYAWPSAATQPLSAIHLEGISGGGTVNVKASGATFTGECTSARPLVTVKDCTAYIDIGLNVMDTDIIFNNTYATGVSAVEIENCLNVNCYKFEAKNDSSSASLDQAVYTKDTVTLRLGLTADTDVSGSTRIDRLIWSKNSKIIVSSGKISVGALTDELLKLEDGTELIVARFSDLLPTGAHMSLFTDRQVATIDSTSKIIAETISSSGSGTSPSPYVITIAWESATNSQRLIQNIIDLLPRPLDPHVELKLPAGTMTDGVYIEDLYGKGVLALEGASKRSSRDMGQTTIFDDNSQTINVTRCSIPIELHSIACDNDTGSAGVYVSYSSRVEITYCYLKAPTGTGSSDLYGNGIKANGIGTHVYSNGNTIGECDRNGMACAAGADIRTNNCDEEDGTNRPQQYGYRAETSGSIYHDSSVFVQGDAGTSLEVTGGKVFT